MPSYGCLLVLCRPLCPRAVSKIAFANCVPEPSTRRDRNGCPPFMNCSLPSRSMPCVWPISPARPRSSANPSLCANAAAPSALIPYWRRLFPAPKLILDLLSYCRYIIQFQGTPGFAALFPIQAPAKLNPQNQASSAPCHASITKSEFLRLILYNLLGISDLDRSLGLPVTLPWREGQGERPQS
jgi:hypothetical protein